MDDVEARLRETLRDRLDPVAAEPARAAATVGAARRGRALRGMAAGLAAVLVAGAAALAVERQPDAGPAPAGRPPTAGTFVLDFGDAGDGTITIDVPKAQACIDLSRNFGRTGSQLRYTDGTIDVVVEHLPGSRRPACQPMDPSDAARALARPARHYVALDPGFVSVRAPLRPLEVVPLLLPDEVIVVCSQDGAVSLTPQARPKRDGVHFRIYNQGGAWDEFNMTSPAGGDAGDALPKREPFANAWNLAPGPYALGCFRDTRPVPFSDARHPDYARFTVVDPQGLWIDPELACDDPRTRPEIVTRERIRSFSDEPDFEALIRELVPGVRADDEIVRATYPESLAKSEHRTVVRDGRKIATILLSSEEDPAEEDRFWWSLRPEVCPGEGIAGS